MTTDFDAIPLGTLEGRALSIGIAKEVGELGSLKNFAYELTQPRRPVCFSQDDNHLLFAKSTLFHGLLFRQDPSS